MDKMTDKYGISYTVSGSGEPFVIFHGWGCNKEMFEFIINHLKERYMVFAFDLPGFGKSSEPTTPYNTSDYAKVMSETFDELGIINPTVLGHSFGGRILIKMSLATQFNKMVLTGSAGVVNKKPMSYYLKVYTYKTLKKLYKIKLIQKLFPGLLDKYQKKAGSSDYQKASPIMKQILSISVNEDISSDFSSVTPSTLLVWGELDSATPLSDGKLMEEKFRDAGLVVFEGATHYAFLEQSKRFLIVLDAFV